MVAPEPDCLFCKIVAGEVPAEIVRESERTLAFRDINPQAPTHVLVISREHYPNAVAAAEKNQGILDEMVVQAHEVAMADTVADSGYRLVLNTGPGAGQTLYHLHMHVLGGRGLEWPPG